MDMVKSGHREREDRYLKKYNKLVRDKIPQIIEEEGRRAVYHKLPDEEYLSALEIKLDEEIQEYKADKNLEEMADVLEVLFALCKARGYSINDLMEKKDEKALIRGGFDEKLYLEYIED